MTDAQRDRGLAAERTALAWNRTGLSAAGVAAVMLKLSWGESTAGVVLSAVLLVLAGVAYTGPRWHRRFLMMSVAMTAAAAVSVVVALHPRVA